MEGWQSSLESDAESPIRELRINGSRVMWKEDVSDVKGVWKMCGAARKIDLNENCELTNAFFDKGVCKNWRIIKISKFNENRKNF